MDPFSRAGLTPGEGLVMRIVRFSIAGLMGAVVVAAVCLAALRNASQAWSGAIFLLTRGVLGLAIINAIYRRGADRAWWLGFCLFGWGYLALVEPRPEIRSPYLSTSLLLVIVRPYLADPVELGPRSIRWVMSQYHYLKIGHGLWARWPPSSAGCWRGSSSLARRIETGRVRPRRFDGRYPRAVVAVADESSSPGRAWCWPPPPSRSGPGGIRGSGPCGLSC